MRPIVHHPWKAIAAAAAVYWLALFTATHTPSLPAGAARFSDKVVHFSAFAVLALLLAGTLWLWRRERAPAPSAAPYLWLLAILFVYAAIDELLQIPIPHRQASVGDWVADVLGAMAGLAVFIVVRSFPHWRRAEGPGSPPGGDAEAQS